MFPGALSTIGLPVQTIAEDKSLPIRSTAITFDPTIQINIEKKSENKARWQNIFMIITWFLRGMASLMLTWEKVRAGLR
jgi:hypothetical protein